MAAQDSFDLAIAQCHGDFGLDLLNTWIPLGLQAAFLLLSFQAVALMVRRSTVSRVPGALHSFNLVSSQQRQ